MTNSEVIKKIQGNLIVSCQALEEEPLFSPYIMGRMAYAAKQGGACGIRANTVVDILEIKKTVDLPIIGIIKKNYENSEVFITPTMEEVDQLVQCGCNIIAMDATKRKRPNGEYLDVFFQDVKEKYKEQLFMADCSTVEEGLEASSLGFDFIGTTLAGYTEYTKGLKLPAMDMIRELSLKCNKPVVAEGGIWRPEELRRAIDEGAFSAVVGTAITRPMEITRYFINGLK